MNAHGGTRWIRPYLLPPLQKETSTDFDGDDSRHPVDLGYVNEGRDRKFFMVKRSPGENADFQWEDEWEDILSKAETKTSRRILQPAVDYTDRDKYRYPEPLLTEPPVDGGYPHLTSLGSLMDHWDQDEDFEGTITETLLHFNFSDPKELEMARKFRDADLPFKLFDVPEVQAANLKWTDEYLSKHFDIEGRANGHTSESPNHYFAFYNMQKWNTEIHGLAPTRKINWNYRRWCQHAHYADAKRLSPDQPHFYWQSGVDQSERFLDHDQQSFISRDLPSWSSTTGNFIVFHPEEHKGIQCRFGERGVVAATHYDGGRNMIAMLTGAKRYILSPPTACGNLGIFTSRESPIYRHSLLNFGHIKYLKDNEAHDNGDSSMSAEERRWLERASQAGAVETVLKAGEVLYIRKWRLGAPIDPMLDSFLLTLNLFPVLFTASHWFHYIISLQKSGKLRLHASQLQMHVLRLLFSFLSSPFAAQCNARSGIGKGSVEFGSAKEVTEECDL